MFSGLCAIWRGGGGSVCREVKQITCGEYRKNGKSNGKASASASVGGGQLFFEALLVEQVRVVAATGEEVFVGAEFDDAAGG